MSEQLAQALYDLRDQRSEINGRDTRFAEQLDSLRQWQSDHLYRHHLERAQARDAEPLLRFLTRTFYIEADWSELTAKPDRIARNIGRIISDPRPLIVAVRLQHSFDRLDYAVTDALLARAGKPRVTPYRYIEAFRSVDPADTGVQQIAWIAELIDLLGDYADNRPAYWAFKMAGGPARALGMGRTYNLLAAGFSAMRAARDLNAGVEQALADQRTILSRLAPNTPVAL